MGGHEWVLLFYPDGKRSSSEVHNIQPGQVPAHNAHLQHAAAAAGAPPGMPALPAPPGAQPPMAGAPPLPRGPNGMQHPGAGADPRLRAPPPAPGAPGAPPGAMPPGAPQAQAQQLMVNPAAQLAAQQQNQQQAAAAAGAGNNDYCALFVALIGETDNPQGVVRLGMWGRWLRLFVQQQLADRP